MPTALPRVSVAITEEQHEILGRMARIQRRPVSSFIRELLDAAMPALRSSLPILEARERTLAEQPQALADAAQCLLAALQGLDPNQLSLLDITETDIQDLANRARLPPADREPGEGSGAPARSGAAARTDAPNPPRTVGTERGKRK